MVMTRGCLLPCNEILESAVNGDVFQKFKQILRDYSDTCPKTVEQTVDGRLT